VCGSAGACGCGGGWKRQGLGGAGNSPGGVGKRQPSVETASGSFPSERTQGTPLTSRASRTSTCGGRSKRGSGLTSGGERRSTAWTSGRGRGASPCSGGCKLQTANCKSQIDGAASCGCAGSGIPVSPCGCVQLPICNLQFAIP